MGRENIIKTPAEFAQEVSGFPYQGVHEESATQRYMLGARYHDVVTGKSWRYGKSSAACYAGRGAASLNRMGGEGLDWSLLSGTQVIGDEEVTFVGGTHPAYTLNQLQGGMILISDSDDGSGLTDNNPQNRTIVGNAASAANAALTVTLDSPLTRATAATTYAFLLPNPYAKVQLSTNAGWNCAIVGVPGLYVSAANQYLWLQTWGPVWCAFQSDLGSKAAMELEAVWRWDGSLTLRDDSAAPGAHSHAQVAGYVLDAGTSATFIFLTMAP